jgi:hypothetical protein
LWRKIRGNIVGVADYSLDYDSIKKLKIVNKGSRKENKK